MRKTNTVRVKMWGSTVGYLHQDEKGIVADSLPDKFGTIVIK